MSLSHASSILVYIRKLIRVIAARLPGLRSRSCPIENSPAKHYENVPDISFPIEGCIAEIKVNPLLLENAFAEMPADVLRKGETSVLETRYNYSAKVLDCARVFSDGVTHISVYNRSNTLRKEFSAHHRIPPPRVLKKKCTTVYTGTTLHLAAEITTLNGNLFHWLLDAMGRVLLLQEKLDQTLQIDRYLIPPNIGSYRECMVAMGIDEDKLIELPMGESVEFEKLVWIANPCGYSSHIVPGWLIQAYRKQFSQIISDGMTKSTRLYISRADATARKFRNEDKLEAAMKERGYQIVKLSEYGLVEKIRLFSEATEVVGMSGAGLVCLMFCRRGTRVIEMYPSTFVNYNIASISYQLGHDHRPYVFPSNSLISKVNSFSGKFEIDVEKFLEFHDSAGPLFVPVVCRA